MKTAPPLAITDAENAIVGALLLESGPTLEKLRTAAIGPASFADVLNGLIVAAAEALHAAGQPVDVATIFPRIKGEVAFESFQERLDTADRACFSAANLPSWIADVAAAAAHRTKLAEARKLVEAAATELPPAPAGPPESEEATFARLAKLSLTDYDRARKAEAARLKIRPALLDKEVAARRPKASAPAATPNIDLTTPEPWPHPVNGAALFDEVAETLQRYVALPPGALVAIVLWIVAAHGFEAFLHSPRLNLNSPEKGCGKTTLLDVICALVPRPLRTESITAAVLFRLVEAFKPVLLLDEVDTYLSEAEELRGLLNAGHKRGAKAYRCEGDNHDVRGYSAFAPAVLAGIGAIAGTLHDRSIVVRLVRAKPNEVAARFDSRRTAHEHELCRKLARWTADNFAALESCDPVLPDGAFNRLADNWRPLFAIAETAGGDWHDRCAKAFATAAAKDDADAHGTGTLLLTDIRETFERQGVDRLPSAQLAEALAKIEGRPWAEFGKHSKPISANQLAKLLRRFGVSSENLRHGDDVAKGYYLERFAEAFERFLPSAGVPNRYAATSPANIDDSADSEPLHRAPCSVSKNRIPTNNDGPCSGVAFANPQPQELFL